MKQICKLVFILILSWIGFSCNQTETNTSNTNNKEKSIVAADANTYRHWAWARPNDKDTDEELATRYQKYYDAGIVGIYFESDGERHYRAAKAQGLQAHRWMWIMNRGDALKAHPEWAAISRTGKSCADHPPYVNYYRWMCPSRTEVTDFLVNDAKNVLDKDYIDGIHMDYVRYSDVVLAVNLWQVYGIEQTQELPEYDFCYCNMCKSKFKEKYNQDVDKMKYPQESLSWRSFRYNAVSNVVKHITDVAHEYKKPITAAVFPTPDVAKRIVRQDWTRWDLDAVYPMIYHGFYGENVQWIGDAVEQGKKEIKDKFPLYAGIHIPDFKNTDEIEKGVKYALNNGADGISIFGDISDEILDILARHKTRK